MAIEELSDIVEELADSMGIHGAHTEEHPDGQCQCRVCFSIEITERIRRAVAVEKALVNAAESGMVNLRELQRWQAHAAKLTEYAVTTRTHREVEE